jgi:tetratricopeptide (TPR) repeat protein
MRKMLDRIKGRFADFIAQRDDLALVVRAGEASVPPLLKIVEGIEAESNSEMFWACTEEFAGPAAYAEAVVKWFATFHLAGRTMMKKKGMTPWPELPALVQSDGTSPGQRLRELMAFSRALLPDPDCVVVWGFFPTKVADPVAHAALFAEVVRHEFPFPWCHHLRVILRDDPADGELKKRLGDAPRLQWYDADLGPAAIEGGAEEELADEGVPLAERMIVLLVSAGMDYRHQRWPQALEKYQLAADYHGTVGNLSVAAAAFNGMGECNVQMTKEDTAEECFRAALVPLTIMQNPPPAIFLNVLVNLGNLCFAQQRWPEAEGYYENGHLMASLAGAAAVKLQCIEQKGAAQGRQGKIDEALATWRFGADIAGQLECKQEQGRLMRRLEEHYGKAGGGLAERQARPGDLDRAAAPS